MSATFALGKASVVPSFGLHPYQIQYTNNETCQDFVWGAFSRFTQKRGAECGVACQAWEDVGNSAVQWVKTKNINIGCNVVQLAWSIIGTLGLAADPLKGQIAGFLIGEFGNFLLGDVWMPLLRHFSLVRAKGKADPLVAAKCFEVGLGNEMLIYIKYTIAGAVDNGMTVFQVIFGCLALSCEFISGLSGISGGGPSCFTVVTSILGIFLAATVLAIDVVDGINNIYPLLSFVEATELCLLGSVCEDGSRSAYYWSGELPKFEWAGVIDNGYLVVLVLWQLVFGILVVSMPCLLNCCNVWKAEVPHQVA